MVQISKVDHYPMKSTSKCYRRYWNWINYWTDQKIDLYKETIWTSYLEKLIYCGVLREHKKMKGEEEGVMIKEWKQTKCTSLSTTFLPPGSKYKWPARSQPWVIENQQGLYFTLKHKRKKLFICLDSCRQKQVPVSRIFAGWEEYT